MSDASDRRVRRRGSRRNSRRRATTPLSDKPFRQLRNPLAPVEALAPEQLERIHQASMHILEEIGLDFLDKETLTIWEQAGARVDRAQQHVWLDRGLVEEALGRAPRSFTLHARNPARSIHVGDNAINFATVGAAPYYADLETGRRPGTLADFRRMVRLAQQCGPLHIVEGLLVEPQDVPSERRHLARWLAQMTLSDKAQTVAAHGRTVAMDYINMAAIVFGGHDVLRARPVMAANVNANSPLRFDGRMLSALLVYARHGQPTIITPFILAGAMSPITMAAAIAQQNAEALAGITLTQLVNPGCPVIYGGFTTNVDMQSGSPAFGTPEGALALLCGAQLARRYGLPYRGSGGLNNAKVPDAQAAYETQMTLWPAVLAHANLILHSAGWLESGLVCSLEKFVLDVEGLAMMHHFLAGLEISDATLALESIATVGPGGHHFGTAHTLARYRDAFYLPILSDRQNYDNWRDNGQQDAAQRAHQVARQLLDAYEPPPLDEAIVEELEAYTGSFDSS
ncbi:MAG: trimethylamine methyltransferase family protein [Candidatus Promineifilaceae bacterium]|nr:trimethylamine methyltransferase family protein [Candidatus Promineifilaceae bacterium]